MHTRTFSLKRIMVLALTILFSSLSFAEVVVIVHPDNSASISAKNVQRIFLGKEKKFPDGKETLPVNQASGAPARDAFDNKILGRSSTQVSAYWSKLVFTGKGIPPKEVDNDQAVIDIVANNPNAIGYVDSSAATGAVKVVNVN